MPIRLFDLLMSLALVPSVVAEAPEVDPPIVGQPANFSGIVGRVRVEVSVDPKDAFVEEPLLFVVRILGETSAKHAPRRESLRIFGDDAERDFWVEPVPDRDAAKAGLWEFAYRLRAKHVDVKETPAVKVVYFQPDRRKYQTTFADPIAVAFRAKPAAPVAAVPKVLRAPAVFLQLAPPPANLASENGSIQPSMAFWLTALLLPPLLCFVVAKLIAWLVPTADLRRRRAMHRAANRALAELKRTDADDATRAAETLKRYVAERFGWDVAEWGPHEAESALKRRGIATEARRKCVRFLAAWDQQRFGPQEATPTAWTKQAWDVIETVEADPCVASC